MGAKKANKIGDIVKGMEIVDQFRERRASGEGWRYLTKLKCSCGNARVVETGNLVRDSFNPECLDCSGNNGGKYVHGASISFKDKDPLRYNCYTRWQAMKRRCTNENDKRYGDYGGRGIRVCDRWMKSFDNFLADMGMPPDKSFQIDRIDNDGDYTPENCKWASRIENSRNKRNNKRILAFGVTLTQSEWAERTGINRETIAARLRRGWSAERALTV